MAFIKIDTDGMLTVINNLNEHADGIETERKNVNDSSAANHDPVPSVEMVTRPTPFPSFMDPSTASGTLSACSQALYSLAEELRTRRQEAIDLNSNGITTNPDSTIVSYYLPDPPEGTADVEAYWDSTDTVDNVRAYNSQSVANAEEESAELDEALKNRDGKSSKGRTYDEILDEIAKHQDVPTYAAAFISSLGVGKYLDLVEALGARNTSYTPVKGMNNMSNASFDSEGAAHDVGILGHVFATASQDGITIYDDDGNPLNMASEAEAAVEEKGHTGRISALNGLLETPGTVYGTDFLVDLAGRLEDNSYDGVSSARAKVEAKYGGAYEGSSMDPLYGVTMAMGNNPNAALTYLTPDGDAAGTPGDRSAERWKLLTERTWDPKVGLEGLTAALGAASSYRGATDPSAPIPNADARATWVTGKTIPYFVNNVAEKDLTDKMKQNLAVVIGNSPEEFNALASGSSISGENKLGLKGSVTDQEFETLLYRVIDNKDAAGTVAASIGQYYHNEIESTVPGSADPKSELHERYQSAAGAMGYLDAMATLRAGDDKTAQDTAKKNMSTTLSVFSTVLSAGVGAATGGTGLAVAGPLLYSTGSTIAQPLITDDLTKDWKVPDTVDADDIQNVLRAQSYVDAARYGQLRDTTLNIAAHNPENDNKPFSFYSEVDGKPTITTPDPMTPNAAQSFIDWRNAVIKSSSSEPTMTGLDGAIQTGWSTGSMQAHPEDIIK